eukprot:scaffold219240_cov29-Tisochrysis_lutea.AAC.2
MRSAASRAFPTAALKISTPAGGIVCASISSLPRYTSTKGRAFAPRSTKNLCIRSPTPVSGGRQAQDAIWRSWSVQNIRSLKGKTWHVDVE